MNGAAMSLGDVYAKRGETILREVGEERFLIPIRISPKDFHSMYLLNEAAAAFIWKEIDGVRPLQSVLDAVLERFEVEREAACTDLLEFVGQLEAAGLLERKA